MAEINLTITIPNNKVDEFRAGFLKANPLPEGVAEKDWLLQSIEQYLTQRYRKGKLLISQEMAQFEDIFIQ